MQKPYFYNLKTILLRCKSHTFRRWKYGFCKSQTQR